MITEGAYYGMQTFDQSLFELVKSGVVAEEVAMATASSPHDFKLMLEADGRHPSGIEQVVT